MREKYEAPLLVCYMWPPAGDKGLECVPKNLPGCEVDSGISDDAALTCAYVVSWDWLGAPPQDTSPLGSQ